jgi:hypothetical protein
MSLRADTSQLVSPGLTASLYPGHGVRGDQVPSTGVHGPALLYQHAVLPGDAAAEFRWVPSTTPGSGTFVLNEDSSATLTGAPDGSYPLNGQWFKDGVLGGASNNTITIGTAGSVAGGALITVAASIFGGSAVGGGTSIAQGATIQATASIQGGAAFSTGGTATAQGAQITVTASIRGGRASNGALSNVLGSLAGNVYVAPPKRVTNRQTH